MKENHDIKNLIQGYLAGSLSQDELERFLELLVSEDKEEIFGGILDECLSDNRYSGLSDPGSYDKIFHDLMSRALEKKARYMTSGQNKRKRRIILWTRVAAAAGVLICLGIGKVLVTGTLGFKHTQVATETLRPVEDLQPGGNKAILRLADGSVIDLDTANNGVLAKQAQTSVVKTEDGQIVYNDLGKNKKSREILYNTISTPRGGQYYLVLPDSSEVWLNAETSIRFPVEFTGSERLVEMSGEAYFDVRKDSDLHFVVKIGDTRVEVLGTEFNVKAYKDEHLKTTLLEGSVRFLHSESETLLLPGQQADLDPVGKITVLDDVNTDEVIAWKNGLFLFNSADIVTIMDQIGRWYNVDVEYEGEIGSDTFSGMISRNSPVSTVLKIMEEAGIEFKIYEDKIVVSVRNRSRF